MTRNEAVKIIRKKPVPSALIRIEKMVLCCADCNYMDDCDLWYSKNFI